MTAITHGNLTHRQYRYWVQQQLNPAQPVQRLLIVIRMSRAHAQLMASAWDHVASQADACRAILRVNADQPGIEFTDSHRPLDTFRLPPTDDVPAAIADFLSEHWVHFPPDSYLVKQAVVEAADGSLYRVSTASHLVCDGISHDLLSQMMASTLESLEAGVSLPRFDCPSFEQNMSQELAQAPQSSTAANERHAPVPFFGKTIAPTEQRKLRVASDLSLADSQALAALADDPRYFYKSTEATLANFFTALIAAWTWHHSHSTQFNIGVPFHGRSAAERKLIGFKSEILSLPATVEPTEPFSHLLRRIHLGVTEVLQNRGTSVANPVHAPAYEVTSNFKFQSIDTTDHPENGYIRVELPYIAGDPESIFFMQLPSAETIGAIRLVLGIKQPLAELTDIDEVMTGLQAAVTALIKNPTLRVADLPFPGPRWQRQIKQWASPSQSAPKLGAIDTWLSCMAQHAHMPALVFGDCSMTHAELAERVASATNALRSDHGLQLADRVAVHSATSIDQIVAYLAVLMAGCVYIPVSTKSNQRQLLEIVDTLHPKLLLNPSGTTDLPLACAAIDTLQADASDSRPDVPPDALAHIFHTSGSTGRPKAIAVSHRALATSLTAFFKAAGFAQGERLYATYDTTFDPWITVIFGALWHGGTVVLGEGSPPSDAHTLTTIIADSEVTTLCTPTAYFHAVSGGMHACSASRWIVGGETLSPRRAQGFRSTNPHTQLVNAYGPTETTIWASTLTVTDDHATQVPIGAPLPTVGFRVADPLGNPTPQGVPGELWLCGPQLSEGYLADSEQTQLSFLQRDGRRWYKSGDLVRWRPDGNLDFLGRTDRQLKVRGHRVEPVEIEDQLCAIPGVLAALVVPVERGQHVKLGAYLKCESLPLSTVELKSRLLRTLPEHKVPAYFAAVEDLPLSANGKLDVSSLPGFDEQNGKESDRLPTLTLWDLRFIFERLLGASGVSVDDDFFALGGDSLLLIELLTEIQAHFGKQLDAAQILENPTVGGIAPLLETNRDNPAKRALVLRNGTRTPLFCIPGAGGIGVEFYPLSLRLPEDQPVVVLRSAGTDGHSYPPASLDDLVQEHVSHILAFGDAKDVYLAGYSVGGAFAYAVARELAQHGVNTLRLFAIDALAPTQEPASKPAWRKRMHALLRPSAGDDLASYARELDRAQAERRIMEASALGQYNRLAQYTLYKSLNEQPGSLAVTYFHAQGTPSQDLQAWQRLTSDFEVIEVRGTHQGDDAIVREPHVKPLAKAIAQRL